MWPSCFGLACYSIANYLTHQSDGETRKSSAEQYQSNGNGEIDPQGRLVWRHGRFLIVRKRVEGPSQLRGRVQQGQEAQHGEPREEKEQMSSSRDTMCTRAARSRRGWLLDMIFAVLGKVRKEVLSTEDSGDSVKHVGW